MKMYFFLVLVLILSLTSLLCTVMEPPQTPSLLITESRRASATVVISSTGGATQYQGGSLGQFKYDEDKGYYFQRSTGQNSDQFRPRYLYHNVEDKWNVGPTPGVDAGHLYNPHPSKTPPTSGWRYADPTIKEPWKDD